MDNQILGLLDKKIEEIVKSHSEALVGGTATDFAAYRELCGKIAGLQMARRELLDLNNKLKTSEDD